MFASIRRHQRWLLILITIPVIISFVWYFDRTSTARSSGGGPGSGDFGYINGRALSREEFVQARDDVRLEVRMFTGRWPEEDPAAMQMLNIDRRIQERLILTEKLRELGVKVPDAAIADWIANIFRDPQTGGFRIEIYQQFVQQVLQPAGYTEADLQRFASRQVGIQHLARMGGLGGGLIPARDAEAEFRTEHAQMAAQAVFFSLTNYLAQVTTNEIVIDQYFRNNLAQYRTPERIRVSYVRFEATNHFAAADQRLALVTNLTAAIEAEYQRRGPDFYKDDEGKVLTQEAAIARIHEEQRLALGLLEAQKEAVTFAEHLFELQEKEPGSTNLLERLASAQGFSAKLTEPFGRFETPPGFTASPMFSQIAFTLTPEQPLASQPVLGEDAIYILALHSRLPSEVPALAQVWDRVVGDYRRREALEAARRAGQAFYSTLTNGLAQGKTFPVLCAEAKVEPVTLPPFSLATRNLPGWESQVDLSSLKDTAAPLAPGATSDFMPSIEGGFVLHLLSREPVDEPVFQREFPDYLAQFRAQHEREAFGDWFRAQLEQVRISGIPSLDRSRTAGEN